MLGNGPWAQDSASSCSGHIPQPVAPSDDLTSGAHTNHSCHLLNTYYVPGFTVCQSIKKQPSLWRRDHFFPILQTLRFLAQGQ